MKKYCWILLLLAGCGGSLSSEQRKEMLDAQKRQGIKKVTEAQIMEVTTQQGRAIVSNLSRLDTAQRTLDSLAKKYAVKIKRLTPNSTNAVEIETQLIEAYITSSITGDSPENIQPVGEDSLLYTKPIVTIKPDSTIVLKGMWSIWFSKRAIVLSMP